MADIRKTNFITMALGLSSALFNLGQRTDTLAAKYVLRGYNPAGSNPITDADLADIGITRAQFDELVTLFTNFIKFLDNNSPAPANYRNILTNYSNDQY